MSILKPFSRVVLACVALLATVSTVRATNYTYAPPPLVGPNVSYNFVGETDTPGFSPAGTEGYFGTPSLGGDALVFNNLDFAAQASNGANDTENGELNVQMALTNPASNSFSVLSIAESGDYTIFNAASAASKVAAVLNLMPSSLQITAVNGVAVAPISVPFNQSFVRDNGTAPDATTPNSLAVTGPVPLIDSGDWHASATFNIAGALANNQLTGRVTGLSLVFDNLLFAASEPGSTVEIQKKLFDITLGTMNPVPEPSSIFLGVLGGLGLVAIGRKKFAKNA
jgi:PEP-CTERM motif